MIIIDIYGLVNRAGLKKLFKVTKLTPFYQRIEKRK